MCAVAAIPWVFAGMSAVSQYNQGEDAKKASSEANQRATTAATTAADQADQANNKANARQPDIVGLASANEQAAKGGGGSTMLTGPQGVDPKSLLLGKTTLLGA